MRAALAAGTWTKVTTGVFVRTSEWRKLRPIAQHRVRVLEATRRLRAPAILSHHSAAAIWGIDVLGGWPRQLDVSQSAATGGRSSGLVRRHTTDLAGMQLMPMGKHLLTTPAQTAVDLARLLPFAGGVAVIDQTIWSARDRGPLATIDEILELVHSAPARRGSARARRAVSFANPLAANVRESQSRVVIAQLGFPKPRIQERMLLRSGRLVFGDFYWPEHDHWGELDGVSKYLTPEFGAERDARSIVLDEKNRENEIRREVRGFSRWEPSDADRPRRLYDILTGDGLPCALPRP